MWQAIKQTFGSIWGWLGIIVGAISLINLGVMYFEVGIGPLIELLVTWYRAIVHPAFDFLFGWLGLDASPWVKDLWSFALIFFMTPIWTWFTLRSTGARLATLSGQRTETSEPEPEVIYVRVNTARRPFFEVLRFLANAVVGGVVAYGVQAAMTASIG